MELLAVIIGLEALKQPCQVLVVSDSKYVVDSIEKKWLNGWLKTGFKGKKNEDLWRRYYKVACTHQVRMQWIKGHNEHPQNERCDQLATAAADGQNLEIDYGYEALSKSAMF
jgi:ribonuclease HI